MHTLYRQYNKNRRFVIALVLGAWLVSGCSSSSDSQSSTEAVATGNTTSSENISTDDNLDLTPSATNPAQAVSTRVEFDITVPAFQSNALQVRLQWGDKDVLAAFVVDESWAVSDDFPVNTENELIVTFSDNNGAITVGSFEQAFRTGSDASETIRISADQFDTERWDDDGDGISNIDELIVGINPGGGDVPEPVQVSLDLMPIKTFRVSWEPSANAEFYRVLENPDGVSGFSAVSGELSASTDEFDLIVALYARLNAEYLVQACNDSGCADSAPVFVTGELEDAVGVFEASNASESDSFGSSVSISADSSTLAVGARSEDSAATGVNGDQNDNSASAAGAVYVFVRSGNRWQQQAYIKASNSDEFDSFGGDLSLSADGNTLAVGADFEDGGAPGIDGDQNDNSVSGAGAIYVYARTGENWQQQAYIKSPNPLRFERFGSSVSLSANGDTLAVGAPGALSTGDGAGVVYAFTRTGGTWQQQAEIRASNAQEDDAFGGQVSLSADGNTLAVGATDDDSAATGINGDQSDNSVSNAGAAYVFVRIGELWQQQAYIKASNTEGLDRFGTGISLSGDGNTLAVGAVWESSGSTFINGNQNDNSNFRSGAIYVFARSGELWQQQAYIKASNSDIQDNLGRDISLSADGNTLVAGVANEDSFATGIDGDENDNSQNSSGAAYVFVRRSGEWQQQAYIKATDTAQSNIFGGAVSVSGDGNTVLIGSANSGIDFRHGLIFLY